MKAALALAALLAIFASLIAVGQDGYQEADLKSLSLNIYIERSGKALVTGYLSDIEGLSFLNSSQYSYDNETGQVYALTDALTSKNGDLWNISLPVGGYYGDYHAAVYMPGDVLVRGIVCSDGLEYLVYASDDSLVADVRGYDVDDPSVEIGYQQPLEPPPGAGAPPAAGMSYRLALPILLVAAIAALVIWKRMASLPPRPEAQVPEEKEAPVGTGEPLPDATGTTTGVTNAEQQAPPAVDESAGGDVPATVDTTVDSTADKAEGVEVLAADDAGRVEPAAILEHPPLKEIEITPEMRAVIETLTVRERSVISALIDRGGRTTQAEIRYETGIPKSSLTGILLSLERRKLVTKKEWGRTNVIELSDWFLSQKERS